MSDSERKYKFNWDETIGTDMENARPSLGAHTRIEMYRLFQFTLRDVLEQNYGADKADSLLRDAGFIAGSAFYGKFLSSATDINELSKLIREHFIEYGVGIFRIEVADVEAMTFTFTVDEDLDCSGMPDSSDVVCVYDEGFIHGILKGFSGKDFDVREVDCWCTGSRTCRFSANPL